MKYLLLTRLFLVVLVSMIIGISGPALAQEIYKLGPSGGTGGNAFCDDDLPHHARVVEVRVFAGQYVDSLQIVYETENGERQSLSKHGGNGGNQNVFTLDEGEYITGISGRYGQYVDSIRIHTNRKTSQLYGGPGGSADYHYEAERGAKIVGFYGRSGNYIDAIGVVVRKKRN